MRKRDKNLNPESLRNITSERQPITDYKKASIEDVEAKVFSRYDFMTGDTTVRKVLIPTKFVKKKKSNYRKLAEER